MVSQSATKEFIHLLISITQHFIPFTQPTNRIEIIFAINISIWKEVSLISSNLPPHQSICTIILNNARAHIIPPLSLDKTLIIRIAFVMFLFFYRRTTPLAEQRFKKYFNICQSCHLILMRP